MYGSEDGLAWILVGAIVIGVLYSVLDGAWQLAVLILAALLALPILVGMLIGWANRRARHNHYGQDPR